MDGTLVDSTAGVVGAWNEFSKSYPGIDVDSILSCTLHPFFSKDSSHWRHIAAHGVRTVDNLRKYCGIDDPVLLEVRSDPYLLTDLSL